MAKEVKILESLGKTEYFQNNINEHLEKGWQLKGGLIQGTSALTVMMYRKV